MATRRREHGSMGPAWPMAVSAAAAGALILLGIAASGHSLAQEEPTRELPSNDTCLGCHDRIRLEFMLPSGEVLDGTVDEPTYAASVHGRAGTQCVDCHTAIDGYPHPDAGATTGRELAIAMNSSCAACHEGAAGWEAVHGGLDSPGVEPPVCSDCHGAHDTAPAADDAATVLTSCAACHDVSASEYDHSAHGIALRRGDTAAPTCLSCHGGGAIHEPGSGETPSCATCHDDTAESYRHSVHGEARAVGEVAAATCTDCHGSPHAARSSADANATTYPLNLPETCGTCHGDPELTARLGLDNVYLQYVDSTHGHALASHGLLVAANCSTCHTSHSILPPDDPTSTVYPSHVAETCGTCHVGILEEYRNSVHGQTVAAGDLTAAICTDCHASHAITTADAPQWQLDVIAECGTCHEESFETFRDTFHGQASGLGFTRAARCSDCHGAHDILPIADPDSSIALDNRVEMCRACHPDANRNFARYQPHADHNDREAYPFLYYAARVMNGLIIGVFAFFGLHTMMWFGRSSLDRLSARRRSGRPGHGRRSTPVAEPGETVVPPPRSPPDPPEPGAQAT